MSGIISDNVGRSSGLVKAVEAAGGAWTQKSKTTLSGDAATWTIDGIFDDNKDIYNIQFILGCTADQELYGRVRQGGATISTSSYEWNMGHAAYNDSWSVGGSTGGTSWSLTPQNIDTFTGQIGFGLWNWYIYKPYGTAQQVQIIESSAANAPDGYVIAEVGSRTLVNTPAAITGLHFLASVGANLKDGSTLWVSYLD